MTALSAQTARSQLRSVALPAEHGGWAFWLEPSLLGLLIAASVSGVWLVVAGLAAFLLHQPVKIALKDRLSGRRYARTQLAEIAVVVYSAVAISTFALALVSAQSPFLTPLLFAIPFAAIQLAYDLSKRGRDAIPEICGALAVGALASMIAMAGGWKFPAALGPWMIVAARAVPSILYVRARLRLEKGKAVQPKVALAVHVGALALLSLLTVEGFVPLQAAAAAALWLLRAGLGLSRFRQAARPRTIGLIEIGVGLVSVALVAWGYV